MLQGKNKHSLPYRVLNINESTWHIWLLKTVTAPRLNTCFTFSGKCLTFIGVITSRARREDGSRGLFRSPPSPPSSLPPALYEVQILDEDLSEHRQDIAGGGGGAVRKGRCDLDMEEKSASAAQASHAI